MTGFKPASDRDAQILLRSRTDRSPLRLLDTEIVFVVLDWRHCRCDINTTFH
jgi:hypothetical protein